MSLYIAAYDIRDNKRRARVARALQQFGFRVQRSVFEVWLEPEEIADFRRTIGPLLAREDEFDLYPVDGRITRARFRWQRPPDRWDSVILD